VTAPVTVTAGDIARMTAVRRAAVSNWRRRHDDFPRPVGGTASSPLFALAEVQEWLRRYGKAFELGTADRAWQRLRALDDDLGLGLVVAAAGAALLRSMGVKDRMYWPGPLGDPSIGRLLRAMAAETSPAEAFEALVERYLTAHARRLTVTRPDIAELMVRLASPGETLFDPACGLGTLLLAAPPGVAAFGQDTDITTATIAAMRLLLRGTETSVEVEDSLRANGFPGLQADAVVCDPPTSDRAWGHEELIADPRWTYGVPPRGESELAWVQHCLAHVRPGGRVVVLLPQTVAARRSGKRIRGALLRAGALRAVVTLPGGPDLWVLRRPEDGDGSPPGVKLVVAPELSTVERQLADPAHEVAVLDLLDDDIDVSPARHRPPDDGRLAIDYASAVQRMSRRDPGLPHIEVVDEHRPLPTTTIGDLVRTGAVRVQPGLPPADDGAVPMLTAEDFMAGKQATGVTGGDPVLLAEGDVVAAPTGIARVIGPADAGVALGQYLTRYRVDPERLDPEFLAGCLRHSEPTSQHGSSRLDVRRTRIPRLPIGEQRQYGRVLTELTAYAEAAADAAEAARRAARLGFEGLLGGQLRPASWHSMEGTDAHRRPV
jgi:hypothetical protein